MELTNEQIEKILAGACSNDTHYEDGYWYESASQEHKIDDLREIQELRREVERLKATLSLVEGVMLSEGFSRKQINEIIPPKEQGHE